MKIGILIVEDAEFWGGATGFWEDHFKILLDDYKDSVNDAELEYEHFVIVNNPEIFEKINVREYAGFIIPGSSHSVNESEKWIEELIAFMRKLHNNGKPLARLFGICFGHQIIARAFGGIVGKNQNNKVIVGSENVYVSKELQDTDLYKHIFGNSQAFTIIEGHSECVIQPPQDAKILGESGSCRYEIMTDGDSILSLQGHPDFTRTAMVDRILPMAIDYGYITPDGVEKCKETLTDVDREKVFHFMISFLRHGLS